MSDILIILVCYNVDLKNLDLIKNLQGQDILIYDNSKNKQEVKKKVYYYHNPNNPGVSKAYNYGIRLARKLKKKYVLLLDHDTKFNMENMSEYLKMSEKYGEDYIYAPIIGGNGKIYSPFVETKIRNLAQDPATFKYEEEYKLDNKSLINSGLMIPLKIIEMIGGFNEKIKLDFSDIYFISKYKEFRNEVILVNLKMNHGLSGDEGLDKHKELNRFRYYCNGAREFKKSSELTLKLNLFVLFRMIRLMLKYRSITPIGIVTQYYLGETTI
ncbi:MAG: glycosyltransferase [Clostridiaceae bacterium]